MTALRVLAAGDRFVLPSLIAEALRDAVDGELEIAELLLPWPHVPFGAVDEVAEASGSVDELVAALSGVEVCVTQMAPLTSEVFAACPELRFVGVTRGGPVNVNLAAAARHGVAVSCAPGRNAAATAEHTVALLLAALRRVPALHAGLAGGVWSGDGYAYEHAGIELEGATVGVVGLGTIGRRVARILRAFGARVVAHDPHAAPEPGVEPVELGELLRRSAVVTLHARLTPQTARMVGAAELAAMPPGGVLVNCARGGLVDQEAVCDALESGHLRAAAFDVFDPEPPDPGSRLLRAPNVVLTPHLAGATRAVAERGARIVAADVRRFLSGDPIAHPAIAP